jgi:hypothetical protein
MKVDRSPEIATFAPTSSPSSPFPYALIAIQGILAPQPTFPHSAQTIGTDMGLRSLALVNLIAASVVVVATQVKEVVLGHSAI